MDYNNLEGHNSMTCGNQKSNSEDFRQCCPKTRLMRYLGLFYRLRLKCNRPKLTFTQIFNLASNPQTTLHDQSHNQSINQLNDYKLKQ